MSDRYNGFTVILDERVTDEEAQRIAAALSMVKGVLEVRPQTADVAADTIIEARVRRELGELLYAVLYPPKKP